MIRQFRRNIVWPIWRLLFPDRLLPYWKVGWMYGGNPTSRHHALAYELDSFLRDPDAAWELACLEMDYRLGIRHTKEPWQQ